VEITSESEIEAIEQAIEDSPSPITIHLQQSLSFLSDRKNPDYRNSIKEAISAVEALCKRITNDPNATLGKALGKLDDETQIKTHKALTKAFENLYGYTSDADGIRHALLDEPTIDFEDAKFMLVSCSNFVNYLTVKASKAGIEL
jgi:hypothetical protein